jgi:hypothetical protein
VSENPYGQNPPQQPPQPPQNPYGTGSPAGENPYGQPTPPPSSPTAGPTASPPANPSEPSSVPPSSDAPAQPAAENPYAQNPYGSAPYGQTPYPQQPGTGGPLGDGLDMYGRPLGTDERPGGVTAAAWITIVLSGISFLLYGFITLAMLIAKDDVTREIDKAIRDSNSNSNFSAEDAYGVVVGILLVVTVWCLISCVLAVFVLRRSNAARILLVISAVVAGLLSLLGIKSVVSAVPLLGAIAVIVLLFTGGANDWFGRRRRY